MSVPEFSPLLGMSAFAATPDPWDEQDWMPMLGYQMPADAGGGVISLSLRTMMGLGV